MWMELNYSYFSGNSDKTVTLKHDGEESKENNRLRGLGYATLYYVSVKFY